MSCSRLSAVEQMLTARQYSGFEHYFESLSPNCKLSASKVALANGIDFARAQKILHKLVDEKILKYTYGLRCPACGLLLDTEEEIPSIEKEYFCYQCDETVEITPDDVEVIYTFDNYPFVVGQQSEKELELDESAALPSESLTQLIESGALDLYAAFFSPTEQDAICQG